jgi:lipopolysaccharide transport system ATP-binding protein
MYARLGFAVAVNVDPDILIIDEVLSVGDAGFQRKSAEKIADFKRAGKTVIIVSHALPAVRLMCDRVVWLDDGRLVEEGPAGEVLDRYTGFSYEERVQHESIVDEHRHGSGEIRIAKVDLLDDNGHSLLLHRTGAPLTIRVSYTAFQRVPDPVFGIVLSTKEGALVFGANTIGRDITIDSVDGAHHIDFVMEHLLLTADAYDLSVYVVDRLLSHTYDSVQSLVRFDVRTDGYFEPGVIRHPGHWVEDEVVRPKSE